MSTSLNAMEDTGDEPDAFDLFVKTCVGEYGWSLDPPRPPTPRAFDIFNDRHFSNYCGKSAQEVFSFFSELPRELRLEIWAVNLRQHRFLDVALSGPTGTGDNQQAGRCNPSKVATHQAFFRSRLASLSPLLSVCRESASVAKSFYSIRIPCSTTLNHAVFMPLSPEWDILNIYTHNVDDSARARVLSEFLHDLKTADLHGHGALHLCLDHRGMEALRDLDVTQLLPPVLQSYRASMAGLRRLFWRCTPRAGLTRIGGNLLHTRTLAWYSTTIPLFPCPDLAADAVEVDFIGADARCIAPDLHQVWVGQDPRPFTSLWAQIQRNAGLPESNSQCQCQVLLAADPCEDATLEQSGGSESPLAVPMGGRAAVDAYLSKEVAEFRRIMGGKSTGDFGRNELSQLEWRSALKDRAPPGVSPLASADEFVEVRVPATAVGFWLFDPADLERLPPANEHLAGKTVWRLADMCIKPELCVFNLQQKS